MENAKGGSGGGGGGKINDENPNSAAAAVVAVEAAEPNSTTQPPSRTPFTNLSQVDADLALARTLQEQERAYMMLRMNGHMSDYGSSDSGSYVDDDDDEDDEEGEDDDEEDDVHEVDDVGELNEDVDSEDDVEEDASDAQSDGEEVDSDRADEPDPSAFASDEAYARALQDVEDRELAVRLMALAGINDFGGEGEDDSEDNDNNSQDTWEEVDPDEMSYEELLALGEVVGSESRGLSSDTIATLPSISYKSQDNQDGSTDQCVICRLDYEDGETLTVLACRHSYHSECINNWLQINKVCPVCSAEVSASAGG